MGRSSETHGVGGGEKKGGKSLDEGSGGEKSVGIFGLREGEEFEAQRHIRGRGDRQGVLGWRGGGREYEILRVLQEGAGAVFFA